jgi:hypothetical protein
MRPLSVKKGGRIAALLGRLVQDADHVGGLDVDHGPRGDAESRVVVDHVEHLERPLRFEHTWVISACHHSLGRSAQKRMYELLGRLRGSGVTKPRTLSTR